MNLVLKGIADYISSTDVDKKFKQICYSEHPEDIIKNNKMPAVDVIGLTEDIIPIQGRMFNSVYRKQYHVSILIIQDAKVEKDVITGAKSLWQLWEYVWEKINLDRTFNGTVRNIASSPINIRVGSIAVKDNSFKIVLEAQFIVYKDQFN